MTSKNNLEEIKNLLKETFNSYMEDESIVYRNGACDALATISRHLGFEDDFLYTDEILKKLENETKEES